MTIETLTDSLVKFVKEKNPKVSNKVLESIKQYLNNQTTSATITSVEVPSLSDVVIPRGRDKSYVTEIVKDKQSESQFVMTQKGSVKGDELLISRQGKKV